MKSRYYSKNNRTSRSIALVALMIFVSLGSAIALGANEAAVAKIVDCQMPVSIHGPKSSSAVIGAELHGNDTVMVAQNGSATLVFVDGVLQKFVGPSVIIMSSKDKSEQGLLGKLATGLAELFFPSGSETERARLAVRGINTSEKPSLTVPLLMFPPSGGFLMTAPDHLEWLPIDNATLYTVSLYDQNRLIFTTRTHDAILSLPGDSLPLEAGQSYYWTVQTDIGNGSLRSEQSAFGMIDTLSHATVMNALKEINSSAFDSRLATVLRINLYQSHGLLVDENREADDLLRQYPHDYTGLLVKAQLCEAMNMYRDAASYYRQALAR